MNPRIAIDRKSNLHSSCNSKKLLLVFTYFFLFCFLVPSTNLLGQTTKTFAASGTWTCPTGVSSITVECWGGGGAGGGSSSFVAPNAGAGGGGGGYTKTSSVSVTPGDDYNITVGKGGTGNANLFSTAVNGDNGGDSYFSANTALAHGGKGGEGNGGSAGGGGTGSSWNGGKGAKAKDNNTSGGGGGGAGSASNGGNANQTTPGAGGSGNSMGSGGRGLSSNQDGHAGNTIGGGGGGAGQSGFLQWFPGGSGADGQVVITYYVNLVPTVSNISANICAGGSITITGTNFIGITAANVKIGGTPVTSITSSTSTQIIAVVASACSGNVTVKTASGTATSSGTFISSSIPSVSATTTYTCVGGSSGTITASGSGGTTPYTYSLNGGTFQSGNLFSGLAASTNTLTIKSNTGCIASTSVVVSPYPNSTDNQTTAGADKWIGHMYSGMSFNNYIGHFTEAETFDEDFGGYTNCFIVSSGATYPSVYTENFSVRFKMNSSRNGLYVADLASDDGSRLYVDGTLIYNNWVDQSFSTRPSVLMNLTGSSSLVYEFYENGGLNRVIFNNGRLILANNLSSNMTQSICKGSTGVAISGDTFGTLPSGISLSGTGYQWTYSTTPSGTRTNISGATSATYSPNTSIAPFNIPGTYYIYRNAKLSSTNNTGVSNYVATNESNAATLIVTPPVGTPVFIFGSTSTRCQGAGSVTYTATATNAGSISYSLDAVSISGGNSINVSTGTVNYSAGWNGASTITGSASGCGGPATSTHTITTGKTPSVSATTTFTCVGGSSGTITASGNGGSTPYTYSLNGGTYQSGNLFTGLAAGTYTLSVKSNAGCTASAPASIIVSPYPNSADDQTTTGVNTWIGHMYRGMNFQNYIGHFTEAETFDEGFGGDYNCFTVSSGATSPSIYTEQFSVRFRMNSSRDGLYTVDLGSDDGTRLNVDGTLIYNNWGDQSFSTRPSVLMNLTGSSSLVYEFYENAINNRVIFNNLKLILANNLTSNTTQTICKGSTGSAISGDSFGTLPSGISPSGTGYQWTYSTTPTGTRTNISGAALATYSPNTSVTPFNVPGTYYIYRNATLSSANNTGVNPYVTTNESNAATLTVSPVSVGGTVNLNATVCSGTNSGTVNLTGNTGSVVRWEYSTNGGSSWTTIANTTTSQTYSNRTQTTQYRAVVQSDVCALVNSNPATITVSPVPSASISYSGSPFCSGGGTGTVTRTGTAGGTYSSTTGLSINSSTGTININSSTIGNYTVTYKVAAGACAAYSTTTNISITAPGSWTGTVSDDWNDNRNWLCGQIPNSAINVTIPNAASYYPMVTSGLVYAKNINIQNGGTITISGGTLQIFGTITNSGVFDVSNGTIEMHGTSAQTIPAGAFTNNNIKNLIISNTNSTGVTLGGTLDVYQSLTYGTGGKKLNTGGYLSLKSSASETAWVGNMTGHTINGDVTVERYAAAINNWQFLSLSTNTAQTIHQAWQENQTAGVVGTVGYGTNITGPTGGIGFDFISPNVSMKYWDNSAGAYKGIMNTAVQFPNKQNGFFVYIRGDRRATASGATPHQPIVLRNKGPLYTGPVNFTIPAKSYYSIGNPYASKVDFGNVAGMSAVGSSFYVWDPLIYGSRGAGGYQTLSSALGYKPLVPTSYYDVSTAYPYLESGQAAFVYNASASSVTLTFKETDKTTSSHLVFRGEEVMSSEFFRTYLSTSSGKIADGNAVAFNSSYQNRLDAYDAVKISNTGENLGLRRDGVILSIEARSPVTVHDTLYFDLKNVARATYQFRFNPQNMQNETLMAFLADNYLKTETEVSLSEPTSVNFTINLDAASYAADRFMIVFRQASTLPVTFVSIKATQKDKNVLLNWHVENENNMQQYEVEKSIDGSNFKKVATTAAKNNGSENYQWIDDNVTSGYHYYRIKSLNKDNSSSYSTVVKVLVGDLKAAINIYPNPITDGIIHLQLKNLPGGQYGVRLINHLGQLVVAKKIEFAGGNGSEDIKWNYNLPRGIYQLEVTKPDGSIEVIKVLY